MSLRSELEAVNDRIAETRRERLRLSGEVTTLASRAELTPGEQTRFDNLMTGCHRLDATLIEDEGQATRLRAQIDEQVTRMLGGTADTGDGAAAVGGRSVTFHRGRDAAEAISRAGALGGADTAAGTRALVDSARAAIGEWTSIRSAVPASFQENAEAMLTGADPRYRGAVAQHVIALSTPEYDRAFTEYMTEGPQFLSSDSRKILKAGEMAACHERAMNEGSVAAGQAMVPPMLDPTINLSNQSVLNPFRQLADIRSINTQVWRGVTSAGVSAEWVAEAAEASDGSPVFSQPSIVPLKADAYTEVSYEIAQDTSIVQDLSMLFADARDQLEGAAFAVGNGSTQPMGVITSLNTLTASRLASTTNGALGAVDLFNLNSVLPARYRPGASWVAHPGIYNLVRQMGISPSPYSSTFWADFAGDVPSKLLGKPVYESSAMIGSLSTATASNDDVIVIGDFKKAMKIVDRVGMSVAVTNVVGPNRRPVGSWGYYAFWRVGSGVIIGDGLRMLVC
ncbi:MAG: phage major capsid protein [Actinomycetota bacterium]|nr:phage major capsid protein [Actinomycetota bacterium]